MDSVMKELRGGNAPENFWARTAPANIVVIIIIIIIITSAEEAGFVCLSVH